MTEPTEREYLEGLRYEDKFPDDSTRAFQPAIPRVCPECHGPLVYNHDVYCPGPLGRVADWPVEPLSCACPPGAWHDPGCYLLTDGDAA